MGEELGETDINRYTRVDNGCVISIIAAGGQKKLSGVSVTQARCFWNLL